MKVRIKKAITLKSSGSFLSKGVAFLACFFLFSIAAIAQTKTITGVVVDEAKEALIGVTVRVTGTTTGTVTDFNGDYSIQAKEGDILEFSYLGTTPQSVKVGTSNKIDVIMKEDSNVLQEAVVIGYGSAKAKDLTSQIAVVKGSELTKHLTASPMQGLQGKVAGVQIVNSGQPGSSPKVYIRGAGNIDKDKQGPLYVVDGMFFDNIDFLSNSDIESLNVLKDASSSAIYGVRAANGVVLITTKKGMANRKPQVTYDGYVGFQKASNVMKMANSEQYSKIFRGIDKDIATVIDNSIALWGGKDGVPSTNTDWYDELLKTAFMQSHSVDIAGGGEGITYSVGVNYLNQDGIMNMPNGYERVNTRARLDFNITSWLKGGVNFFLTNDDKQENAGSAWTQAYYNPSIYPVYDKSQVSNLNTDGFASGEQINLDNFFWNPVAIANYEKNRQEKKTRILPSYYLQANLFEDKLSLRTAFSQDVEFSRRREVIPVYNVGGNQKRDESYLLKKTNFRNNWILDNTITYRDAIGKHNYSIMAGNSVRQDFDEYLRGEAKGIPTEFPEYWYIHNGQQIEQNLKDRDHWADNGNKFRGLSFFGRLMYDYDGKYLLSATFRADGSSKYQEKWGYFPSVGIGWVVSEEPFMKDSGTVDFLKLRANWGRLGNDKIQASTGFASITSTQGFFNDVLVPGITQTSFFSYLGWEVVEEYDLGFDVTFLKNRLSLNFDYFNRTTNNAVFEKKISLIPQTILTNGGKINNKGVELSINWNDRVNKDFGYNIGFNGTYVKNKVTELDGRDQEILNNGVQVNKIGSPVNSFFGYKVVGVYQNQAELDADPIAKANNLEVGDFKYLDANGDGKLTAEDRVVLGSHIPKFRIGGNLGFDYKNFDFNLAFQGLFDYQIFNRKRYLRNYRASVNFDENWAKNIWTPENPTNKYPSAKGSVNGWNIGRVNSFFVEDANTFTIQNITLGYTFNNIFPKNGNKSSLRLSLTAERPFNFFSYNGFTTDISDSIDADIYPLASTFSFGIKFIY